MTGCQSQARWLGFPAPWVLEPRLAVQCCGAEPDPTALQIKGQGSVRAAEGVRRAAPGHYVDIQWPCQGIPQYQDRLLPAASRKDPTSSILSQPCPQRSFIGTGISQDAFRLLLCYHQAGSPEDGKISPSHQFCKRGPGGSKATLSPSEDSSESSPLEHNDRTRTWSEIYHTSYLARCQPLSWGRHVLD